MAIEGLTHAETIVIALAAAEQALASAEARGRRTDCLRGAVADLRGALKNVRMEDTAAAAEQARADAMAARGRA